MKKLIQFYSASTFDPMMKSNNARIEEVGNDLHLHTPYNAAFVNDVKNIPGRRWDSDHKAWIVPSKHYDKALSITQKHFSDVDHPRQSPGTIVNGKNVGGEFAPKNMGATKTSLKTPEIPKSPEELFTLDQLEEEKRAPKSEPRVSYDTPYDSDFVSAVRKIPGAEWNAASKKWSVPTEQADRYFELINKYYPVSSQSSKMGENPPSPYFRIGSGSLGVYDKPVNGEVCKDKSGNYWKISQVNSQYYKEDGLSFGVGDESGYIYSCKLEPASENDISRAKENEDKRKKIFDADKALSAEFNKVATSGQPVNRSDIPSGATKIVIKKSGHWANQDPEVLYTDGNTLWAGKLEYDGGDSWEYHYRKLLGTKPLITKIKKYSEDMKTEIPAIARDVNPISYTQEEWDKKRKSEQHDLSTLLVRKQKERDEKFQSIKQSSGDPALYKKVQPVRDAIRKYKEYKQKADIAETYKKFEAQDSEKAKKNSDFMSAFTPQAITYDKSTYTITGTNGKIIKADIIGNQLNFLDFDGVNVPRPSQKTPEYENFKTVIIKKMEMINEKPGSSMPIPFRIKSDEEIASNKKKEEEASKTKQAVIDKVNEVAKSIKITGISFDGDVYSISGKDNQYISAAIENGELKFETVNDMVPPVQQSINLIELRRTIIRKIKAQNKTADRPIPVPMMKSASMIVFTK